VTPILLPLAVSWSKVIGWLVVAVAVAVGLIGLKVILESGNDPNKDFMAEMGKGIGAILLAVAVGTAGLKLAGVIDPDWVKDPFNL
jgi:hypothetical protein